MKEGNPRLTFLEASSLIMGSGVGGGIMAVPFLASLSGFLPFVLVLAAALGINILIHLMLVEVMFRDGRGSQLVELIRRYVFIGRAGLPVTWLFFSILLISFLANLSAYISGGGEILSSLTGIPVVFSRVLVYSAAAGVVFFGLKIVGRFEHLALYGIAVLVVIIIGSVLPAPFRLHLSLSSAIRFRSVLALYGMVMYGLYSFFAVPQVVKGLMPDRRKTILSVVTGLCLNGALTFIITLIALGVSGEVTEVAILGIGRALGVPARIAGSLFILFAMLTSFWSISLALADILKERTGMGRQVAWFLATFPPLVLALTGVLGFIGALGVAGGAVALILVIITIPMYIRAKREGPVTDPGWSLGGWGHPAVLGIIIVLILAMAAGSMYAV